jgi:hypothetical protein
MPCLVGCIALSAPRIALVLVWLFGGDWLGAAYRTWIWPVLGFFLLPLTTLCYAYAWHLGGGEIGGLGIVLIVIAVLFDLGLLGGGARARRREKVVTIRGEKVG